MLYYEERIKSLEQELQQLRQAKRERQDDHVWGAIIRLLQEIVSIGMEVQVQILGQLLPDASDLTKSGAVKDEEASN